MTSAESARDAAEAAASNLEPETVLVGDLDTVGFTRAAAATMFAAAARPAEVAAATLRLAVDLGRIGPAAAAVAASLNPTPPLPIDPTDKRFADVTWRENPAFFALRQAFLASRRFADEVTALCRNDMDRAKTELLVSLMFDTVAPTNFLSTNPAALKRAMETGGLSTLRGMRNFTEDLLINKGRPRQVDTAAFTVGENLASTPGKVVYRSPLMELIQYAPQTDAVHEVPLLASPPWINKYYIMDLAPGRSFLEWAVQHQRTVFAISYRNPDATMRHLTMDDYLVEGPRAAIRVIQDITGAETVDVVGLCLGGTLTAITGAYLARTRDAQIGSITLLNTLLDFSEPGPLGAFVDEPTVTRLEAKMARSGVLAGGDMATTFDLLRANDLIFNYVVSSWLMGERPPAFDILAWNADSTRMPAAMHSFYLRRFYLENALANGALEIAGERLALQDLKNDVYLVGAVNDHIVPWTSSYKSVALLGGDVRYVLCNGGHIAGIVNPPAPKSWYDIADSYPSTPTAWRRLARRSSGSWWEDWADWGSARAGALGPPPPIGSAEHPPIDDAPGRYVHE
jgi:polyhydroxyalkanoate synthase subunit PhaC